MIKSIDIVSALDDLRIEKHRTIQYITEGIISNRNYTRLLNGEAVITTDVLIDLLDRLNVPFNEFINYLFLKNEADNYDEEYLVILVLYENYEKAINRFKQVVAKENMNIMLGKKAVHAAMGYMDYYQKKIGLDALKELLKGLIKLKDIEKSGVIHESDIYTMYMYIKIASPEERETIGRFLIQYYLSNKYRVIATRYEICNMVAYACIFYYLCNQPVVTKETDTYIKKLAEIVFEYNANCKFTPFDIIIFEILYKYFKKYNMKQKYTTFYYIASILATSNNDFLRGRIFDITEEDLEVYYKFINDDKFVNSMMYKRMINREL